MLQEPSLSYCGQQTPGRGKTLPDVQGNATEDGGICVRSQLNWSTRKRGERSVRESQLSTLINYNKYFQRVNEGDRAGKGWGLPDFISHSDLYKPEEDKEYLVNDTLIFRVTNVEVTSV